MTERQARSVQERETEQARRDFLTGLPTFLRKRGIPADIPVDIRPDAADSRPVYIVTGASFTRYDHALHGDHPGHDFSAYAGGAHEKYLLNNTAAIFERLIQDGERVVLHTKNPDLVADIIKSKGLGDHVRVVTGDLAGREILAALYDALGDLSIHAPVSDIRMALYQSFAQNNGEPFKEMYREDSAEVERAAARRINFVYNMTAMGYDLLVNRHMPSLRIVSLSALAASRATYGLMADSTDKFMNELAWRTFHLESCFLTGKPVSLYQINPGITTACDVYRDDKARRLVRAESLADGFPMDDAVFTGQDDLPQMSSRDVALVADAMLRTPDGHDPNDGLSPHIESLLYGGFDKQELRRRFSEAIRLDEGRGAIDIDPDRVLPEHIITPQVSYGRLPDRIRPGDYRRISLTPPGQRF